MINGPLIINPLALPDTTPEQTKVGVEPDPAVRAKVLPVILRKVAVVPVMVLVERPEVNVPVLV